MQKVDHFILILIELDVWRQGLSNGYCVVVRICNKSQFYIHAELAGGRAHQKL